MEGQMLIPRQIIEEITHRTDIVDLIGGYVNLKRAGSNYNGLCPFHSEKTPSFTVFPSSQSFYCFGCGAGGDAITFTMKSENLDYPSALELMAKRAGITIPQDPKDQARGMSRQRVYDMNLAAAKYFRQCLYDENVGGVGLRYLRESRKLSESVIKHFGLGFAPDGFGGLTMHMKKLGFTEEELVEGFLCGKSKKTGRAYDYFRNRVIFPIIDTAGNVIGFGGRVMDDSKPKYLNSSDTPGFKKSKNLFALNYAKRHCSEQLILCEGYMDVIALHSAGFENAVATLGTALTVDQARVMAKYTKKVIISYDSDGAGQAATARAIKMLSDAGLEVKVIKMNDAKDPDEYIKKFGKDSFARLVGESRSGFDFRLDSILSGHDVSIAEEKIRAAEEICRYIAGVWASVEREVYISRAASRLGLSVEGIKADVERIRRAEIRQYNSKVSQNAKMSAMGVGDRTNPETIKNIRAAAAEEAIIGLLLMFEEYRSDVQNGRVPLGGDDFCTSLGKRVFEKIMELHASEGGFMYSLLGEYFTPDEMGRIQRAEQSRRALTENGIQVLVGCVNTLKEEKNKVSDADGGSNIDEIRRLLESKRNKK